MAERAEPASGTRDFLASDVRRREHALSLLRTVFERYHFDPLQTPAFERLEVLTGKYGDEGDKLIFKILRRGEHETTGQADLALRYDLTVPLARVVATYGSQLATPYRRYAMGPVWRADRPGKGRFREFMQCDVDIVGSSSRMADAEVLWAVNDGLEALGLEGFQFQLNSRNALHGLLEAHGVTDELASGVLITLDKLDKLDPEVVVDELTSRGLDSEVARELVKTVAAGDAAEIRERLHQVDTGRAGLSEIDEMLRLTETLPEGRVVFAPRLVRGLDYYTGPIWEVVAPGYSGSVASGGRYDTLIATLGGPELPACGGSIGIERILAGQVPAADADEKALDVAVTVADPDSAPELVSLAGALRHAGLTVGTYLGASRKLAKQLRWASDARARVVVILGEQERAAGAVSIRDMRDASQSEVPMAQAVNAIRRLLYS